VDKSLDRRLVEVAQVTGTLPGFLTEHQGLRVDEAEGINDDLALDGLDRIDDDGDGAGRKLFEGLLGLDINR
jgi:hypothetical protein